jgi:hypothetical protein
MPTVEAPKGIVVTVATPDGRLIRAGNGYHVPYGSVIMGSKPGMIEKPGSTFHSPDPVVMYVASPPSELNYGTLLFTLGVGAIIWSHWGGLGLIVFGLVYNLIAYIWKNAWKKALTDYKPPVRSSPIASATSSDGGPAGTAKP